MHACPSRVPDFLHQPANETVLVRLFERMERIGMVGEGGRLSKRRGQQEGGR